MLEVHGMPVTWSAGVQRDAEKVLQVDYIKVVQNTFPLRLSCLHKARLISLNVTFLTCRSAACLVVVVIYYQSTMPGPGTRTMPAAVLDPGHV